MQGKALLNMQLVLATQALPRRVKKTLFLAGPSTRNPDVADWRHAAVAELTALGFDGAVFIPLPAHVYATGDEKSQDAAARWHYEEQIAWEAQARACADVIVFWVPRQIDRQREDLGMPGLTTNFELGEDLHSGRVVYGRPSDAQKCRYLDDRVEEAGLPVHTDLRETLETALRLLGEGAERVGTETQVPLLVWKHPGFQSWYSNLKAAGNRLDAAKVKSVVLVGPQQKCFSFTMWVSVWVDKEGRFKSNEVIVSRKNISAVACFCRTDDGVQLALVREFRSTVNNPDGFVYELAGGSSPDDAADPRACAQEEVFEEMGLHIEDISRFKEVGQRQLMATFSTHQASLFALELTPQEFAVLQKRASDATCFGTQEEGASSERTYVVTHPLSRLTSLNVDYTTLGMVLEAAQQLNLLHLP